MTSYDGLQNRLFRMASDLLVRPEEAASSWWRHVPSQRSASKWTGDPLGISYEYSGSYIGSYIGRCIIICGKLSNDT